MKNITQKYLKEILHYGPDTGEFMWLVVRRGTRLDKIAGNSAREGYSRIMINGCGYMAHRLAWLYVHGKFLSGAIDHINHQKDDNRIENLRPVTNQGNQQNQKLYTNNKSGVCGVYFRGRTGKWEASIHHKGRCKYLGYFKCLTAAMLARKAAEVAYGYHKNHGKSL